jgi:hypothetical protein
MNAVLESGDMTAAGTRVQDRELHVHLLCAQSTASNPQ